jgi:hypothetical protein
MRWSCPRPMPKTKERRVVALVAFAICLASGTNFAQDAPSPSLGDLARQQRQQKQDAKATTGNPKTVITNEQLPEHDADPAQSETNGDKESRSRPGSEKGMQSSGQLKAQILAEKKQISSLEAQIEKVNESIRFAPANCAVNCVSWNERQVAKQGQVEGMQSQLEERKKQLEEMQESARKQGYGNSVYEP